MTYKLHGLLSGVGLAVSMNTKALFRDDPCNSGRSKV